MRLFSLITLAGLAPFLLVMQSHAADALDCDNASTTVEMIQCADADYKSADKLLNDAYRQRRENLDKTGEKLLRDAQRAWIKFRDAQCAVERDGARGGTMAPLLYIACQEYLTRQRTHTLLTSYFPLKEVQDRTHWLLGREAIGPFQCGKQQTAKAGLSPRYNAIEGRARFYAHIQIGEETVDIPIEDATQDSLCGTDLTLSSVKQDDGCALLRVDDGLCDAAFVVWDTAHRRYIWQRAN